MENFNGLKVGDKIKIAKLDSSWGVKIDRVLTINYTTPHNCNVLGRGVYFKERMSSSFRIHADDCILVNDDLKLFNSSQLDKMKDNLKTLKEDYETKKASLEEKIKFCEDNGLDIFDEKLFKVFKAMEAIDGTSKLSRIEQAKAVLEVVKMK